MNVTKLQQTLPALTTFDWTRGAGLAEVKRQPASLIVDGQLVVHGEDGEGFIDYYGDFRGGYPYIAPELVSWAEKNGAYWEWRDAGSIVLVA
jgi:hypothetical protein